MQEEGLDVYANQVGFSFSPFDVVLDFGLQPTDPKGSRKPVVRVRMSPQHALVMTKLLVKNLNEYQARIGRILLPGELYKELGISED
jgi:hypothetical protein